MIGKFRNADVIIRGYVQARDGWNKEVDLQEAKSIGQKLSEVVAPYLKVLLPLVQLKDWGNLELSKDNTRVMDTEVERIEVKIFYKE